VSGQIVCEMAITQYWYGLAADIFFGFDLKASGDHFYQGRFRDRLMRSAGSVWR
jgi:hypothetical protein